VIDLDEPLQSSDGEQESEPSHPRVVFILGAGFSRALSSQMVCTDKLGERIRAKLENLPPNLTRGASFEDWLARLAEPQPDQSVESNLRRQTDFQAIVRTLAAELETAQEESQLLGLPPWLNRLITVAHFWQSTLISFNYDTLIESSTPGCLLQMPNPLQIPVTIPLSSGDAIGQMPPLPNGPSRAPFPSFRLLKLHGSLAWSWVFGDTTGLTIARMPIDEEEVFASTIVKTSSPFVGESRQIIAEPPEDPVSRKARLLPSRTQFIAPPSGAKSGYYQNPFMNALWTNARLALEEADEVYFVGYSMPSADTTARGLFRESLRPDAKIVIVNPCPTQIHDQITKWGFNDIDVLSKPNCVEQMVEMLEDRRGKEAFIRLKRRFAVGDLDSTANPNALVMPYGTSSGRQTLRQYAINGSSLVLQECSDDVGGLKIPELLELISREDIEDIRIRNENAKSEQRVVHFEFGWSQDGASAKMPLTLSLRVATVPNSNSSEQ